MNLVKSKSHLFPISLELFGTFKKEITNTRTVLFRDLKLSSKELSNAAESILVKKISESKGCLWGEVYPWLISDFLEIPDQKKETIAKGWLAIYLHTIYIDKCLDENGKIFKNELLASSLLAKYGLINLYGIVKDTKYENIFNQSIDSSANYELSDLLNQNSIENLQLKEETAIGKNRIILACAGAFAAVDTKNSKYIIEFTNSLLLTLQYLDDVTDNYIDFKNNNYTYLLASAVSNQESFNKIQSENELLEKLVSSDALLNTISKIHSSLLKTISILSSFRKKRFSITTLSYLNLLNKSVYDFKIYLSENGGSKYDRLPKKLKQAILKDVQKKIYILSVTT